MAMVESGEEQHARGQTQGQDRAGPVANPVITRLADNWGRRAAVKRTSAEIDAAQFDPGLPDYPEALLPFREHPTYDQLRSDTRYALLAWASVAFNKNVVDIEQQVVNPGFGLLAAGTYDTGLDDAMAIAVVQAMVDEEFHSLLHLQASTVVRRERRLSQPSTVLPLAYKARRYRERMAGSTCQWQRELIALAYTTAAEISVNSYLELMANDDRVQPVNRVTAALHSRDEYCHAQVAAEIAKATYPRLDRERQGFFLSALADGMDAFAVNDYLMWYRIVELVGVPGGEQMVRDIERDPRRKRLLQDFKALRRLCVEMDVLDDIRFDWSNVLFA